MIKLKPEQQKQEIRQITLNWLQRFVIGLNLCPFANYELERQSLRIAVSLASNRAELSDDFLQEITLLTANSTIATTLFVFPNFSKDFFAYLDFLALAESKLKELGYAGVYQLASFHPHYCFAGAAVTAVSNYTNRSPYPMLHVLREESLDKALAFYGDTAKIPKANITKLKELGLTKVKKMLAACLLDKNEPKE